MMDDERDTVVSRTDPQKLDTIVSTRVFVYRSRIFEWELSPGNPEDDEEIDAQVWRLAASLYEEEEQFMAKLSTPNL